MRKRKGDGPQDLFLSTLVVVYASLIIKAMKVRVFRYLNRDMIVYV